MTNDTERQVACQGCGTSTTTAFQCPLCQAEGATDRGFFCTQACFAKNWLEHRNTLHKSGVAVRERKPAAATAANRAAAEGTPRKARKRERATAATADDDGGAGAAAVQRATLFAPWPALPSAALCAKHHWATITPPLPLDAPRAVVRPQPSASDTLEQEGDIARYFWSALLSAAHYAAASVKSDPSLQVLVVAGDVYSAHGFAWAARCAGLTGLLQLAVSRSASTGDAPPSLLAKERRGEGESDEAAAASTDRHPSLSAYFTAHKRVVIATADVVRASASRHSTASSAVSGAASLWLASAPPNHSLLLTLPDVVEPADLQGVQTRAVFFTGPNGTGEDDEEEVEADGGDRGDEEEPKQAEAARYTYSNLEVMSENGQQPLQWSPVCVPAPGTSASSADGADEARSEGDAVRQNDARQLHAPHNPSARLDDDISTCFANGDLAGALHGLLRSFTHAPGQFEASLFYLLCSNWGAASLAHAHHRLAYVARFFADQSRRLSNAKKNGSLADAALRAVAAVVKLLPRLRDAAAESAAASASASAADNSNNNSSRVSKKSARKKVAKTEPDAAAAALIDESSVTCAFPTLATTTRATLPVPDVSAPTALELSRLANYYTHLPNLQLQATVCYLYPVASSAVLDTLARAWGLHRYLPGPSSLAVVEKARSAAALRVRQRYTMKLDAQQAEFYLVLMQLVYDALGPYSLSVDEVRRRLMWDLTLAHDAGSLEAFLQCCALLPNAEGLLLPTAKKQKVKKAAVPSADATTTPASMSATSSSSAAAAAATDTAVNGMEGGGSLAKMNALSSRQPHGKPRRETARSRTEALRCFAVKTTTFADNDFGFIELPWRQFPIAGERQRQIDRLHAAAVEEVLMAMPRTPRPMYVSDVGNLIGKWNHFNTRYDGVLGATLQVFLEAHPEAFRVVDRLVTRRTAGATEQVRVRFDNDEEQDNHHHGDDDDDDDEHDARFRRNLDRQLLTGQKGKHGKPAVELPARARKKRAVKAFNKERFNRNYKSIDASARVPGYVKRGPRRIKGRGKKANKRVVKRGS